MPTGKRGSKKSETIGSSQRQCSFRLVKSQARSRANGSGPYVIEARRPGGSVWTAGVVGLDLEYAAEQMRRLEGSGCPIEYNDNFQPVKKRK